jgi:hypothetical protein
MRGGSCAGRSPNGERAWVDEPAHASPMPHAPRVGQGGKAGIGKQTMRIQGSMSAVDPLRHSPVQLRCGMHRIGWSLSTISLSALVASGCNLAERRAESVEQVTAQVVAKRVSDCGVGPVTIRFDELEQSEILTAASASGATDEQLSCADKAASHYTLELPAGPQARYDAIRNERYSTKFLTEARTWLSDRGLLERVPPYEAGITDDAAFTRDIENLCGPRAKGAFQSEYGFHAISPNWVKRSLTLPPDKEGTDALACIMNMARVSGYEFGFIGNEAFATER